MIKNEVERAPTSESEVLNLVMTPTISIIIRNGINSYCFYDCDFDVFIPEFKPVFGQGA